MRVDSENHAVSFDTLHVEYLDWCRTWLSTGNMHG